jgi:hypothetical protein
MKQPNNNQIVVEFDTKQFHKMYLVSYPYK